MTRQDQLRGGRDQRPLDRNKMGFALILTISMLTFLVLLLVSLAALTKIEYEVDRNSQSHARARQNALLGLDVAIGQLQLHAGPDTRVTARAEILDDVPATPAMEDVAAPNWTGVWDSSDTGALPRTWLVSGNENPDDPLAFAPITGLAVPAAENENVWLLNKTVFFDSSFSDPQVDPRVIVQRIPIRSDGIPGLAVDDKVTIGHYGYWIGDEGLKASIRSVRPTDPVIGSRQDWDQQRRPRVRYERVLPNISEPGLASTEDVLPRVLAFHQLAFLDSVTRADLRRRFHDSTVVTGAVLADSESGGLKVDLSSPASTDPLTRWLGIRPIVSPSVDPTDPFFHELAYDWTGIPDGEMVSGPSSLVAPIMTEFEIILNFRLATGVGNQKLSGSIRLELWNPYAAALDSSVDSVRVELRNLPNIKVTENDGTTVTVSTIDVARSINNGSSEVDAVIQMTGMGIPIGPGQIVESTLSLAGLSFRDADDNPVTFGDFVGTELDPKVDPGRLPLEVALRLVDGVDVPLIAWQEYRQTVTGSFGAESVHLKFRGRLREPETFDVSDPWPDPRQVYLSDENDVLASDPFAVEESFGLGTGSSSFNTDSLFFLIGNRAVLFDLPRSAPLSLGTLQHVSLQRNRGEANLPLFPPDTGWGESVADVYDRYFLSGMLIGGLPTDPFDAATLIGTDYFRLISPVDGSVLTNEVVVAAPAAHLLLTQSFNLNSTSVLAWRAALGGTEFSQWYYDGGEKSASLANAFFRFPHQASNLSTYATLPTGDPWVQGVRDLGPNTQISDLAVKLVELIKERGPFASVRAFIESRVLEDAIASLSGSNEINPSGIPGSVLAPSRLTQSDILTSLAPFASARSDTFLVRSYGDAANPVTGMTEARAWCEAVVQRLPAYVVDKAVGGNDPWEDPTGDNITFGRRFEIIYFRWLSPDDI